MYASPNNRAASAAASIAIVAGIGAVLVFGLQAGRVAEAAAQSLVALNITPPRPTPSPTPPPPKKSAKSAPKGDPGQRNLKNKATQIVAIKPPILIVPPPPVVVATTPANTGNATQSGMSNRPGPGQGAGNYGNGLGGGGNGGDGDGIAETGPRKIRGRLAFEDLPEDALMPGEEAQVEVRYTVEADGRATGCRAVRSSGFPQIDAVACRLIERRYLFRPALNGAGRPVRAIVEESHTWVLDEERMRRR
jgi:protein TonB